MSNIIGIKEAKKILSNGISIKYNNKFLTEKDFENEKLYIKISEKISPIDNPSNLIRVKEIIEDTIDEAYKYICENNCIKFSEMEMQYLPSTIYALEYRGKIRIENNIIYLV